MKRSLFIVLAAVVALLVGVASFFIAAPFATPQAIAPNVVEAWEAPEVSGLTPVGESLLPAEGLPAAYVTDLDPSSPAVLEAQAAARLDVLETAALAGETPAAPTLGSGLFTRAIDPCALLVDPAGGCDGAPATVLGGGFTDELVLRAQTRQSCATGPGESTVSFVVYASAAGHLDVDYTVLDEERTIRVDPTAIALAEWDAAGRDGYLPYCVSLTGLPSGWSSMVVIHGFSEFGARADVEVSLSLRSDNVTPPSWVEPLTKTAVMVSVPMKDVSTVRFRAFVVPFGEPARGCDFDDLDAAIEPTMQDAEFVSAAQLEANNYDYQFIERHTAVFVVPEASTISFCVGWVDSHSWDTNVPDHVYSRVLHSPNLVLPSISVSTLTIDEPTAVSTLTAKIGGTSLVCGTWGSDVFDNGPLCDYRELDEMALGWDDALVVTALSTGFGSTGKRVYHLAVSPQICGYGCELPRTQFFDIPLESQTNQCLGNGCSRSHVGTARLRVDWFDEQQSWADSWIRAGSAAATGAGPVFDRRADVELGPINAEGTEQSAELRVVTDRESTARVIVDRSLYSSDNVRVVDDLVFAEDRTISLGSLPTGQPFAVTVEVTDRDGNTNVYSIDPSRGREWVNGGFMTDPIERDFDVTVSVSRDGEKFAVGNYSATVGSMVFESIIDDRNRFTCTTDSGPINLEAPTTPAGYNFNSNFTLEIELIDLRPEFNFENCGSYVADVERRNNVNDVRVSQPLVFGSTTTFTVDGYTIVATVSESRPRA